MFSFKSLINLLKVLFCSGLSMGGCKIDRVGGDIIIDFVKIKYLINFENIYIGSP